MEEWVKINDEVWQKQAEIDWEQRRYEIAKDILPHTILLEYYGKGLERGVKDAVMIADALIAELKKGGEE